MKVIVNDLKCYNNKKLNNALSQVLLKFSESLIHKLEIKSDDSLCINIVPEEEFSNIVGLNKCRFMAVSDEKGIFCKPYDSGLMEYFRILKHEIVHLLLLKNKNTLLDWIHEGCAVFFSNQIYILDKQVKQNKVLNIKYLAQNFLNNRECYFYSAIYIKFLYERHKNLFFKLLDNEIELQDFEIDAIEYFNSLTNRNI